MSDQYDGHLSDNQATEDLRELERRLDLDAAIWSAGLSSVERAVERARQTPYTVARAETTTDRADDLPMSSPHFEQHALSTRGQTFMPIQRIRAFGAAAAAVVVVALLAALFSTIGAGHSKVGSGGSPSATGTPQQIAATPTVTAPGPYSMYIVNIATASGVDSNGQPVNPTAAFLVNQSVYVTMQVDNPPPGTGHVDVRWFLNGSSQPFAGSDIVTRTVNGSQNIYFSAASASAGDGTARIFWDLPAGDMGTDLSDPHLVATINFTVYATPPTATPTPGLTPIPGPTPTFGPTPTPSATPSPTPAG